MSLTFSSDYRIDAIQEDCRLSNMPTRFRYFVYGLSDDGDNPPVQIRSGTAVPQQRLVNIQYLFASNGVDVTLKGIKKPRSHFKVRVGLRRDLRDHVGLCSAILQTIVYHLEGRLKIDPEMRYGLPGIPKTRSSKVYQGCSR